MKKVIFNDTSDWAEMIFPNGTYIKVNYKYMKDPQNLSNRIL